MKKTLLILILVQCLSQVKVLAQARWKSVGRHPCYKGVEVSLVNHGQNEGVYLWGVKLQNNYSRPVQLKYRLIVGGEQYAKGYWQVTRWLNPGEEWEEGGGKVTALLFKNNSINTTVQIQEVCFNKDKGCFNNCYAQCDNGSPNQPDCGKSTQTNTQANNGSSQNSSSGGAGAANVQAKIDAIQVHLDKIPGSDSESQAIIRDATRITKSGASEQSIINQLDPLLTRARNRANALATTKKEEDTAKEAEDKAATERNNSFKGYYDKGMADYSSKNYDGAINNLQTSLNYAVNDQQRTQVNDWIGKIREEKRIEAEAAARKVRVDDKLIQEQQVNNEAAVATAGAIALLSLLRDRYNDKPVNIRLQAGLGLESIPIILNDNFNKKSSIETTFHYSIMLGFKLGILNQKGVSFHLNPVYYAGFNAGTQGTDGRHGTYGGFATLQMGLKAESVFKLYGEGGWLKRSGNYNYDQDAANGGNTASDLVQTGTYDYSLLRFGGGIMLHFVNAPRETYVKGGIYFEKLSFAPQKPQMVGSLQVNISSQIILDFLYSKNYAIAGSADYPGSLATLSSLSAFFPENNRSYFSVRFIRQGIF